jgi:KUP system potassium uptake protein
MNRIPAKKNLPLTLAALGVVFGDIGTSPLYAMPAALHGLPVDAHNVMGVLSLIFWALILVISTRYMSIFLQADNRGEGGVLALLALLRRKQSKFYSGLFLLGVVGAGLLLGDGMLTPAISVLSAVEGLKVASPSLAHYILPATVIILLALFLCQRFGTGKIGISFGPILLIWFIIIAVLGLIRILQHPSVIYAVNPYYAVLFFYHNGWMAYKLLGGVFLVITGAEALYADLGHFGRTPIRMSWFVVVLPALLLSYFGQGAYLIEFPAAISNPFYEQSPPWFYYPLLIMATAATIIASQAVISASFSLTKQAILLNLCPRLTIIQTSTIEHGQIYVPPVNVILAIGTLFLVLFFQNSAALAGAYGIAVNLVMVIVAIFVMMVAHQYWHWSVAKILRVFSVFMLIDLAFLGANFHKVLEGGWMPLLFAFLCALVMLTWHNGVQLLRASHFMDKVDLRQIVEEFNQADFYYLPGAAAIFIADPYDQSGGSFLHHLKQIQILPENILIVSAVVTKYPYVMPENRFELIKLSDRIYRLILHFGFMQTIDVPQTLKIGEKMNCLPFQLEMNQILYLVETIEINVTRKRYPGIFFWQKKMFRWLFRNSAVDYKFFRLPYNRTISLGTCCKI